MRDLAMTTNKAMIVVVIACAICVTLTLLPYVIAFGALPINTTKPELWAHFATYFSGVLGPLLSILNLVAIVYIAVQLTQLQQSAVASKRLSLDLYSDWHAQELHSSRIEVSKLLAELTEATTPLPTLSEVEDKYVAQEDHVFRIYHFFEKWALLCRENQIDAKLLQTLLGGYAGWWRDEYFSKIRPRETDPYMQPVLELIHEQVFMHAPQRSQREEVPNEARP
jgi:hypothetical protein